MADKFILYGDATPIITMEGNADGGPKDVIHHDIKQVLGGAPTIVNASEALGEAKWFIQMNRELGESTISHLMGFGSYTDGTAYDTGDTIMGCYVKHLGVDEEGNAVAGVLDLCLNLTTAPVIRLHPGDSWSNRLAPSVNTDVGSFKVKNDNDHHTMMDIILFCDHTP